MKLDRFLAVLAAVLLMGLPLFAQTTANLTGTVTLGGNPLPGATVTISSSALQGTRTAITDSNGNYNFGALAPGEYTVKIEMESMTAVTKTSRVSLAQTTRVDVDMKLSAVAEAITVTAASPAVLETTEVQTNITSKLIEDLPIGRSLLATVSLAPGVNSNGPGGNTTISGAPSYDNLYLVDGVNVNENLRGQPHDLFIEDAIQETTILTGAISAEYGRFTGGVVTAISKSGGNEFNGTVRDSLQNDKWTAETPRKVKRTNDKINSTYEGTLGGRIIRDRLWFFTAGRYFQRDSQRTLVDNPLNAPPRGTETSVSYVNSRKQSRAELKLTLQITPKHSFQASGLNIDDKDGLHSYSAYELASLAPGRELPNSFMAGHYNGVIANNFLIEANGSRKMYAFVKDGSHVSTTDLVGGTTLYDANLGLNMNTSTFCGTCDNESRNNRNWNAKGTYYWSTPSMGTHSIVGGYDTWHQSLRSNNHQSPSDFEIYSLGMTEARDANGVARVTSLPGDGSTFILWWPILVASRGNDLATNSFFVNDKWDFNNRLSFNIGVRHDKNHGLDSAGNKIADDSKWTPRLGLIYDVKGDGRFRLNASYSEYVAAIADGNVADAASPAGSPSLLYWGYYGDDIPANSTPAQTVAKIMDWFKSVGGVKNHDFLFGGSSNGIGTIIPKPLASPYVTEWSVGAGTQLGKRGFLRADLIHRNWKNFYTLQDQFNVTGLAPDPLAGGADVDVAWQVITNDFKRKYDALQLQTSYSIMSRLNVGGNYTYSKLKGNYSGGETSGSGPVSSNGVKYYPEYLQYPNNPTSKYGYMPSDQRHKARLWMTYDHPTHIGVFNVSLLENFDSGSAYSASGSVDPRWFRNAAGNIVARPNPGYASPPTSGTYYFSERGAFHTPNVTSTNVALNYNLPPINRLQFYVETELRNAFNEHGAVSVDSTVLTRKQSACRYINTAGASVRCDAFDPFTDKPVLGKNYQLGPSFGKPVRDTTFLVQGDYQLPRTYLISVGAKF